MIFGSLFTPMFHGEARKMAELEQQRNLANVRAEAVRRAERFQVRDNQFALISFDNFERLLAEGLVE